MAASSPAVLIRGPRSEERHGDRIRRWPRPPRWSLRSQSQRVARIFLDDIFPFFLSVAFTFQFSHEPPQAMATSGILCAGAVCARRSSRDVDTVGWWASWGRDLRWLLWMVHGVWDRSVQLCSMGRRGCWCVGPVGRICCFAREMSPRERAANEWLWGVTRRTGHWALDDVASHVANVLQTFHMFQ